MSHWKNRVRVARPDESHPGDRQSLSGPSPPGYRLRPVRRLVRATLAVCAAGCLLGTVLFALEWRGQAHQWPSFAASVSRTAQHLAQGIQRLR